MIPEAEEERFQLALRSAEMASSQGTPSAGLLFILKAQVHAAHAREAGEPWAAELLGRYRAAVQEYEERHFRVPGA